MKLKKGDTVKVVAGKDKGKTGGVEAVFSKENKVLVTGVNQYKRHTKARRDGEKSEIKIITKPLPVAAVMFVCPKCKQSARIGYSVQGSEKVRICKKCEEAV
ncbi:MAG: 50S ribosomal protein L24 [Candidatus Levybacteria bacterium]|nr:50S ribosomal protein L24 [Candidatus Levybacteria bacterium]